MGWTRLYLGALNPIDQGQWHAQNLLRRTGESLELQIQRLWETLQVEDTIGSEVPPWLEPLLRGLVWAVAIGFGVAVLFWLSQVLPRWWQRWQTSMPTAGTLQPQRIEPPLALQDWLARAQDAQAQHNYGAACRALYMAMLIRLEEADWLIRDPARTDQEYLQRLDALWALTPQSVDLPRAWRQLFQTHEAAYYGAAPVSAERFQSCQSAYQLLAPALGPGGLKSSEAR